MKTKRVIITPGAIDSNKGDQALVTSCIKLIKRISPETEIGVVSISAKDVDNPDGEMRHTRRFGVKGLCSILLSPRRGSLRRRGARDTKFVEFIMALNSILDFTWSLVVLLLAPWPRLAKLFLSRAKRECFDFMRTSSCIFIKGGGFIYAYKGLRYSYYLYFQLYTLMLAHKFRVPVVIMPNSFGPFESKFSRRLSRKVLSRCRIVACREKLSVKRLHEIGLGGELVRYLPDMGFMVDSISREKAEQLLRDFGVNTKGGNVGITVRPWRFPNHKNPEKAWSYYIDSMSEFAKYIISKGYKPIFFPQSIGAHDHEDDRIAIRRLCENLEEGSYCFVNGDWLPEELVGMYGCMDLFVGTRMHSVIFSMTNSVPVIAISYQGPKATGIMQEAGLEEFAIDISEVSFDKMKNMFDNLERNKAEAAKKITNTVVRFKTSLEKWEQEISQLITD